MHFSSRIRWFDAALLIAAAFFSFGFAAATALAPRPESAGVAVIFAPWTDARETLALSASAGSRFVRFGAFDFIAVVQPENWEFAKDVRARGAWFVADPSALAACFKPFAPGKV